MGPEREPDPDDDEIAARIARDWEARLARTLAGGRDRTAYRSAEAYRDALLLEPLLRGEPHAWERLRFSFGTNAKRLRAIENIRTHYAHLGSRIDGLRLDRLAFEEDIARGLRGRSFWLRAVAVVVVVLILCAPFLWYKPRESLRVATAGQLATFGVASSSEFVDAPPHGWHRIAIGIDRETWTSPTGKTVVELRTMHTAGGLPTFNGLDGTLEEQSCANGAYTDYVWDGRAPDGSAGQREEAYITWHSGETVRFTSDVSGSDYADATLRRLPQSWAQALCERAATGR